MTRNDQLADVIRLACLTASRTNAEQRALIALAWDCDREHNANTTTNRRRGARSKPDWQLQDLVSLAVASRDLDPADGDREVPTPKRWAETWARWMGELADA